MVLSQTKAQQKKSYKTDAARFAETVRTGRDILRLYGCTAAVTACMLLVIFAAREIAPFGDKVLRYAEDGDQYFGLLGYLLHVFSGSDNLLYSWSNILGGNMMGTFAYFMASPYNLLTIFFPDDLMSAYHLIFVLKFISAAICFAVLLDHMFANIEWQTIVLFSASYPFIGYMSYYAWNQSWMDGVILLPLVVLGIWQILRRGRFLLYTLALAVCLLSNYYIGYMVCIASVLFLICGLIVWHGELNKSELIGAVLRYAASSVIAAALTAAVLLPAYAALPAERVESIQDLVEGFHFTSSAQETASMLFTAPYDDMRWQDNYPVIFTGIVQMVMAVLFFLNRSVPRTLKLVSAGLLGVFFISFAFSVPNVIWHGFSENNWYNFRYSFLFSFTLELLAFYSFVHISEVRSRIALGGVIVGLVTMAALSTPMENISAGTLFWDAVLILVTLALLHLYAAPPASGSKAGKTAAFLTISVLVLMNLTVNTYLTWDSLGELKDYQKARLTDAAIKAALDDDSFYRLGSTWRYGDCDPMRAGYAGVENYSSSENYEAVDAAKRLGLTSRWTGHAAYDDNVPLATDALLGLKYVVTDESFKSEFYPAIGMAEASGLLVLQNDRALPLLFPGETLSETDVDSTKPFDVINDYWNSVSSRGGNVLRPLHTETRQEGLDVTLSFTADSNGPVYAYAPKGDVTLDVPFTSLNRDIFYVGTYSAGEPGQLKLRASKTYKGIEDIVLYTEDPEVLAEKAAAVQAKTMELREISSSHLQAKVELSKDGFVTSTIPFDEGWSVYVDGDRVKTYRNMDTFLTFDVSAGVHDIELVYWPPLFGAGIAISCAALVALVVWILIERKQRMEQSVQPTPKKTSNIATVQLAAH